MAQWRCHPTPLAFNSREAGHTKQELKSEEPEDETPRQAFFFMLASPSQSDPLNASAFFVLMALAYHGFEPCSGRCIQ